MGAGQQKMLLTYFLCGLTNRLPHTKNVSLPIDYHKVFTSKSFCGAHKKILMYKFCGSPRRLPPFFFYKKLLYENVLSDLWPKERLRRQVFVGLPQNVYVENNCCGHQVLQNVFDLNISYASSTTTTKCFTSKTFCGTKRPKKNMM